MLHFIMKVNFIKLTGLLTPCEDENGTETGVFGPVDPTLKSTFEFLDQFFEEITKTFPDTYLHIGGDEVELSSCWRSNQKLNEILEDWGMPLDYTGLESLYIQQLQIMLSQKSVKKQTVVWQEIFDNGGILHPETIIEVWKGWGRGWQYELNLVCIFIISAHWTISYNLPVYNIVHVVKTNFYVHDAVRKSEQCFLIHILFPDSCMGYNSYFHVSFTFLVLLFWTFLVCFSGPPTPSSQKE